MSDILTPLPCAFCGNAPQMYVTETEYYIECINKDCPTMPSTGGYATADTVIAVWNTRAPAVGVTEAV